VPAPIVIDLYPAETDFDGVRVYRPPLQALAIGVIDLAFKYPREMGHVAALGLIAGLCWYFAYDAIHCRRQNPTTKKRGRGQ
jgi:hypothetical protein